MKIAAIFLAVQALAVLAIPLPKLDSREVLDNREAEAEACGIDAGIARRYNCNGIYDGKIKREAEPSIDIREPILVAREDEKQYGGGGIYDGKVKREDEYVYNSGHIYDAKVKREDERQYGSGGISDARVKREDDRIYNSNGIYDA